MKARIVVLMSTCLLILSLGTVSSVMAHPVVLSNAVSSSLFTPAGPCGIFSDVSAHDYYCYGLNYMNSKGAVGGYPDGTFKPTNGVTRAQFSKMIMKTYEWPTNVSGGPHFTDVSVGSTFYDYVETVFNKGIITGYTGVDGTWNPCIQQYEDHNHNYFHPCYNITRGQMAKFNANAAVFNDYTMGRSSTFYDVPASDTYFTYIERLVMHIAAPPFPPPAPTCNSSTQPCFFPTVDVFRSDAVASIFEAWSYRTDQTVRGRAFARKWSATASLDGVYAYMSMPNKTLNSGVWISGPIVVSSTYNRHWIESGPQELCSSGSSCGYHPYGSSFDGNLSHGVVGGWNITYNLTPGTSYGYQSYAAGNNVWWSEYWTGSSWARMATSSDNGNDLGVASLEYVNGAVETSSTLVQSGPLQVSDFQMHTAGGSWSNTCYDLNIVPRKMFISTFGTCSTSGTGAYSWLVEYKYQSGTSAKGEQP